jgi:TetR/AcrR family transcriptional repressor of bet genes
MGRKPNTESRRQQIVLALLMEMSTSGYERASTVSIAKRAGLAPGLIHYHFKNKEEILLALVDELILQAEAGFAAAMEASTTASAKLEAYITSRVGLGPTSDGVQVKAWVSILAEAMGQDAVRSRVAEWLAKDHSRLSRLFKAAGSERAKEHASMLLAMILGSFSLHAINISSVPKGYAEPQILQWLGAVITTQKTKSSGP